MRGIWQGWRVMGIGAKVTDVLIGRKGRWWPWKTGSRAPPTTSGADIKNGESTVKEGERRPLGSVWIGCGNITSPPCVGPWYVFPFIV